MNDRHRLVLVVTAVGLAVWFLVAGSGSLALAGVSLALLICPLVMGVVMWLLMRQTQPIPPKGEVDPHDERARLGRR